MNDNIQHLRDLLVSKQKIAIALSGGLDSSVLLAFAVSVLGKDNCLAITATTPYMVQQELAEAETFCKQLGVRHVAITFSIPDEILNNPPERCYLCKHRLFEAIKTRAETAGFPYVADGTNMDDDGDYRPGRKAMLELGIASPFHECGLTKDDIRHLARDLQLPESVSAKHAQACLLTRLPHNTRIQEPTLRMIEQAEAFIRSQGFASCRVRTHGTIARIELLNEDLLRFFSGNTYITIREHLLQLGYASVSLDLTGYRRGSMNEQS